MTRIWFFYGAFILLTVAIVLFLWEYITTINAMYKKLEMIHDYTLLQK